MIFFLQWLPESARFDMTRGNRERALATLERIAKDNGKPMPLGKLIEPSSKVSPMGINSQRKPMPLGKLIEPSSKVSPMRINSQRKPMPLGKLIEPSSKVSPMGIKSQR